MNWNLFYCLIFGFVCCSCIKVPAEVVLASRVVDESLVSGREMTIGWIEATYREARSRLDAELKREWYPRYQSRLLASLSPEESAQLAQSLLSPDDARPLQQWQDALMGEYLSRQARLHGELDQAQKTMVAGVNQWYEQVAQLQGAVTAYLESGRELSLGRQELLSGLESLRGREPELDRALERTRELWLLLQNQNPAPELEKIMTLARPDEGGSNEH